MKQLGLFDTDSDKKNHARSTWTLFVDGASRKNPGNAGAGIYLSNNDIPTIRKGFYLGEKTNNQAEYLALLLGVFYAKRYIHLGDTLYIMADSELLIRQLKGEYAVRNPELKAMHAMAKEMLKDIHYKCFHVMREKNVIADELANHGIDKKIKMPLEFLHVAQAHGVSV